MFRRKNEADDKQQATRLENSVTQENTTETLDDGIISGNFNTKPVNYKNTNELSVESPLRKKGHRTNRNNRPRKTLTPSSPTAAAIQLFDSKRTKTASSSRGCTSTSASTVTYRSDNSGSDYKHDLLNSSSQYELLNSNLSQISSTTMSDEQMLRRESSSTYERDMDIIDLLQRDRSMDIAAEFRGGGGATGINKAGPYGNDVYVCEDMGKSARYENVTMSKSSSSERRKLPDISRIVDQHSPKQTNDSRQTFPNFVFTHQHHHQSQQTQPSPLSNCLNNNLNGQSNRDGAIPKDTRKIRHI